jgi:alkanesulfonate monooxygenase SsuD/methylene tetrahydromethanopterin reductase-like flavin-dependent oxidoreductase (luciferase family)
MRHGIVLFTCDRGITPAQAARAAEERGFDTFYVPEHTHIPVKREAAHPRTGDGTLPDDRYSRTLDPPPGDLEAWAAAGATELLWGLPDASREVVEGYLDRLAGRVKA